MARRTSQRLDLLPTKAPGRSGVTAASCSLVSPGGGLGIDSFGARPCWEQSTGPSLAWAVASLRFAPARLVVRRAHRRTPTCEGGGFSAWLKGLTYALANSSGTFGRVAFPFSESGNRAEEVPWQDEGRESSVGWHSPFWRCYWRHVQAVRRRHRRRRLRHHRERPPRPALRRPPRRAAGRSSPSIHVEPRGRRRLRSRT